MPYYYTKSLILSQYFSFLKSINISHLNMLYLGYSRMIFIKKPYYDLEKKYKDIVSLFSGEVKESFQRLDKISKQNLEYYQYYENLKVHYQNIEQDIFPKAEGAMQQLLVAVKDHQNKAFNLLYPATKTTIELFSDSVQSLIVQLQKIMQPEEETKKRVIQVKEMIRLFRTEYFNRVHTLSLVETQFNTLLKNLDDMMINVDQKIDAGDYDESLLSINKMAKVTQKVLSLLDKLPKICTLIQTVIPEKLVKLVDDVELLVKQGYPLHHLLIKDTINKAKDELEYCRGKLNNFDIVEMEPQLLAIHDRLTQFYPLFEKEKSAKIIFDQDYEMMYAKVNQVEKTFSKLNAQLPRTKKIYVLEDAKLKDVEKITTIISQLNLTKRGLDTLVLSGTKQPYSLQVDKINLLRTESEKAEILLDEFHQYITSLKKLSEEAYNSVNLYYLKFKEGEKALLDSHIPSLIERYQLQSTVFYQRLKLIVDTLSLMPIDMNIIQDNLRFIQTDGEALLKEMNSTVSLAKETEKLLVQANQDRHRTTDHQRIMVLAEQAFFDGKFEKAHLEATNLLKKIQTVKQGK
jgi:septation ring formation regulator